MVDSALQDARFLQRVEQSFNVEDLTNDRLETWMVRGDSGKGIQPKTSQLAEQLSIGGDLHRLINSSGTLNQIENIEPNIENAKTHKEIIRNQFRRKRENIARNIFENVGASGQGLQKIINALERNNYDLNKLKYHAFQIRGKTRIGVWEEGRSGFIANISVEPRIIGEQEPSFEFGGEE